MTLVMGHLTESDDDTAYDAIIDSVAEMVGNQVANTPSDVTVDVMDAGSDGYHFRLLLDVQ